MFTLSRTARWCQYLINSAFRSFFWGPVWARGRCRISPPRFLAECCKRQLNQVSFVSLYFRLSTFLICIEFVYLYFPVLFCLSVSVKWFAVKTASEMTYNVSSGALNSTPTNPTFFWGCQKSALIAILKTPSGSARAHTHTHTHPFNGPLSGTTRVSGYQKGKTNLDFTEARDSGWQWHQLGHMQVCISLQTDNHASTPPVTTQVFLQAGCPSCRPTNSVKALKALPSGSTSFNSWLRCYRIV